jgi:hypothetical protein
MRKTDLSRSACRWLQPPRGCPPGRWLTRSVGEQTTFPEIIGAYDAVSSWAKANGRELAGPPREIYVGQVTGDRPHMEIAWPIR